MHRAVIAVAVAAALAASSGARAAGATQLQPLVSAPSAESGRFTNESPNLWFVEFPSAPLADSGDDATLDREHAAFQREAAAQGARFLERMRFKSLWNGVSVQASTTDIARIRQLSSVKAIYPVRIHAMPRTETVSPELATAIQMTRADIAQTELGLSGRGVRVAVMDTGIDYDHADLGGDGVQRSDSHVFPTARVTTGWDFVGDKYNVDPASPSYDPMPVPDPYPDDCGGHGTHVSGIIGAKGQVTGVAPGVTFGAYRVFGCEGSTSDDVMLAAMERILDDRMDVLNMSIGDAFDNWPGAPTAAAASRLVKKGVVVVASIGNSGANGLWSGGAPGVGENVIGVASFDNIRSTNPAFSVSPDGKLVGYDQATAAAKAPLTGTFALARTGTPTTANDGCNPISGVAGKIALIRRGTCSFYQKAANAQAAGAVGVVLYNNQPGRVTPTVAGATAITIPVVAVSAADGAVMDARIAAGPTTLTWTNQTVSVATTTGNLISSFSSYGLAADLSLKPDIGAPGGYIWSTLPLEQGGHGSMSGTSMASPHVAGAVALLLESRGDLMRHGGRRDDDAAGAWRRSADDDENVHHATTVRDVLQNSAKPKLWWAAPAYGFLDNVQRQGAGMLDITAAVLATSAVTPGKLSLGDGYGPVTRTLNLSNSGGAPVTYTFAHEPALANGPEIYAPTFWDGFATVSFSAASVTLRPGESRRVDVTVTPDATLPDDSIYGGYIVATPTVGEPLRVPYVGLTGDYHALQILNETIFGGSPLLLDAGGNDVAPDHAFTLADSDLPAIFFHMDLQARRLTLSIVDATSGRPLGRAVDVDYMPRNDIKTAYFTVAWDGTYVPGVQGTNNVKVAPNGTYRLVLAVEKPLARPGNPADVETWTSAPIVIAR